MSRRIFLIGLAGAAALGCSPRMTPQERAVEEQVVRDRTGAWMRAFNNQARDSLATFYVQGPELTVVWPAGQRTNGWEEEASAQQEYFREVTTLNLVSQDVRVVVLAPDVAVATFRHSTDEIRGTDRDLFSGHGTLIWVKPAPRASWVIRVQHLSRTPAAAAAGGRR